MSAIPTWTDIHCHLEMLKSATAEVLDRAQAVGVHRCVTIGTHPDDFQKVLEITERFYPSVVCTLGVHPHEANRWDSSISEFLECHLTRPYVVAVGEIGLDFYYKHSAPEAQTLAFSQQIELALKYDLPIQVHTRDAEPETRKILESYAGKGLRGVLHCFTGSGEMAQWALDFGFDLSISGIVTFKGAQQLRETVRQVPLERLHIETDAPFLAPVPMRGRENEPAYVSYVAQMVASEKGVTLEKLSEQLEKNLRRLFPRLNEASKK